MRSEEELSQFSILVAQSYRILRLKIEMSTGLCDAVVRATCVRSLVQL
jgi:hypothetical protein